MSNLTRMLVLAAVVAPTAAAAQDGVAEAAAVITAEDYAWRVGVIAHDSMAGRNTPSPGLEKTARWIAEEFGRLGLRGGGDDGTFLQNYPLESVFVDAEASSVEVGDRTLRFGEDLLPLFGSPLDGSLEGDLVVISGTEVSDALTGAVAGKHVLWVLPAGKRGVDRSLFRVLGLLRSSGAASVMVTDRADGEAWAAASRRALRPSVRRPSSGDEGGRRMAGPMFRVRESAVARVVAAAGLTLGDLEARDGEPVEVHPAGGLTVRMNTRLVVEETSAPNVVGILEGSDPELRDEYVVFSAHMDHVGIGAPDESGDSIFNGADDDASGTVAVIEVARAMAALNPAPRRSMIFVLVSGEEKGLWGSEYFASHPPVPVERLVANINADMVGRNWPDTIVAIGKEHSDLGETLNRVNARHPELNMTAIDDKWPEERFYYRSDHYNFARKGVPILFFFNGVHEDYHRASDEPDKIDAEKAARIAKLIFYLGVEIGNADRRPEWDPESYRRIVTEGSGR